MFRELRRARYIRRSENSRDSVPPLDNWLVEIKNDLHDTRGDHPASGFASAWRARLELAMLTLVYAPVRTRVAHVAVPADESRV